MHRIPTSNHIPIFIREESRYASSPSFSRYAPSRRRIEFLFPLDRLPAGWEQYYDPVERELVRYEPCGGLIPYRITVRPVPMPPDGPMPMEEALAAIQDFCDGGGMVA